MSPTDGLFWVLCLVALCFLLAAVRYYRLLTEERAKAQKFEQLLERERALLNTSPEAIICWDKASGEQKISPAAARILGCEPDEPVSSDTISGLAGSADRSELASSIQALVDEGRNFDTQVSAAPDKRYSLSGRAVFTGGGHLAVLWLRDDSSAAYEISAERRMGEGYRRLLDVFPFPAWRRRKDLSLEYVNNAYLEAVEAKPDAKPETLPELAAGAIRENGRELAGRAAETRDPQSETHHIVAAGARRLMELTEVPVGADGGIGGFAIDLTDMEDVREELARHVQSHEQVHRSRT